MQKPKYPTVTALTLVAIQVLAARLPASAGHDLSRLIRDLDAQVQRRFLDTSRGFGMGRIITLGHRTNGMLPAFVPENDAESELVRELTTRGVTAALYLGNRTLLGPKPSAEEWSRLNAEPDPQRNWPVGGSGWRQRPGLQGPVIIAAGARAPLPPDALALWDDAARAFAHGVDPSTAAFRSGPWTVVATPVYASESCLSCHNHSPEASARDGRSTDQRYQPGDTLGIVLYATRGGMR